MRKRQWSGVIVHFWSKATPDKGSTTFGISLKNPFSNEIDKYISYIFISGKCHCHDLTYSSSAI